MAAVQCKSCDWGDEDGRDGNMKLCRRNTVAIVTTHFTECPWPNEFMLKKALEPYVKLELT